jgi:hypothetical protein
MINRALIKKRGYSKFSLTILEYCGAEELMVREKYYFNLLKPLFFFVTGGASYKIKKKRSGLLSGAAALQNIIY